MKDSELVDRGVVTVFNSDYLVTKRNDLITARFIDMSYEELRLIDMLVSLIQPTDIDFKPYKFDISYLMEFLGVDDPDKYITIPKVTKRLMSDVIEIKEKNKIIQVPFPWLSYAEYDKTTGTVTLKLNPVLKPYLLGLKSNFTRHKVFYSQILKKSKYSLRLYQILKRYEYEDNDPVIDLEELKYMLDTDYKEYKDFRRRVLEPSQKAINNKSDILFKYEEIKEKRKVMSLKFIIDSKKDLQGTENAFTINDNEEDQKAINSIIEILEKRLNYKSARELYFAANKDINALKFYYEYCMDRDKKNPDKPINNLKNYILKIIECEKEKPKEMKVSNKKSSKNTANFEQRNYTKKDFKDLEDKLLGRGDYADPDENVRRNLEDESFD